MRKDKVEVHRRQKTCLNKRQKTEKGNRGGVLSLTRRKSRNTESNQTDRNRIKRGE